MTLRCGIIGAGKIGWRYDGGVWDGQRSVSHASAIDRHPDTTLVAIMDPILEARQAFVDTGPYHKDIAVSADLETFLAQDLDLVAIASPSENHYHDILACLEVAVPRLLVEKPVTLIIHDFRDLSHRLQNMHAPPRVVVNFFRRFLPLFHHLKNHLNSAQGSTSVSVNYSRRLDVNGVHLLDVIGFLFDVDDHPPLDWKSRANPDNPSFGLTIAGVSITVTGQDLPYHALDIRITDDRGRLSVVQGGRNATWEVKEKNPDYSGFSHLSLPEPLLGFETAADMMRDGTYLALCNLVDDTKPSLSPFISANFSQTLMQEALT